MGIAYKELFCVNRPIYGPGPGGFFIKRFKESGYSEAELLDLISEMDFSLAGAENDISLKKKCEVIEKAVTETHYTSWALALIGSVISLFGLLIKLIKQPSVRGLMSYQPLVVSAVLILIVLGVYATLRIRFERSKTMLLCALDHIEVIEETGQDCKTK